MTEETLFELARKTPEAERAVLLDRACEGKPELRQRVEALLQADADSSPLSKQSPLLEQTAGFSHTVAQTSPDAVGTLIDGRFKLLQKLGEGGMGTVWVAEQEQPVKRRVALKLIKAGMDSAQVIRRFEAERQALALMDHTNIAKVLDAGTTDNGRPYFVMELVKGVPITKYCDEIHASIKNRLELFVQVCSAVQHAHQKGIIHRDIKPSNILVAMQDGKPVPKVIDFGVAKALHTKLADQSMYTEIGQIIGTLEYMAPEQAELSAMDIDTRADIYALGVLLYELLTGSTPITRERMKSAAFAEVIRLIKEEDPPKPSTRLTQSKESLANLAALRKTDPKHLSSELKGELDWVVLKALEKDRTCRYETANGLARDIQRYLADEVVEARPPSTGYRMKKFVRRNKGKVIAAGLILLALLVGMAGTTWGLLEARRQEGFAREEAIEKEKQRGIAEVNERKALAAAEQEKQAKVQIASQLKQIELVNDTVLNIFAGFDIRNIRASNESVEVLLAKILVEAGRTLNEKAIPDPLVLAKVRNRLGKTLHGLGFYSEAIELFLAARATWSEKLGPDHPDTLSSMANLAISYRAAGKLDLALPLLEESLKRRQATLGPDHPETLISMSNLALGYDSAGKLDLALPLFEETLNRRKASVGSDHPHTLSSMSNLALAYHTAGKLNLALPLFEETLRLRKAILGTDHPDTLASMGSLAMGYQSAGKRDLALPLYEETFRLQKARIGPDHPVTLVTMCNLATEYHDAGRLDLALPLFEETLRLTKAKLGPDHPNTLNCMDRMALGYHSAGKLDLALPLWDETLRLRKAKLGPDHPDTLRSMHNVAAGYGSKKQWDEAIRLYLQMLPLQEKKLGRPHPITQKMLANLGSAYYEAGRMVEAIPLLEEVYQSSKKHPSLRYVGPDLLIFYAKASKLTEMAKLIDELLADAQRNLSKESPQWALLRAQIGMALLDARRFAEAEPHLRESLAIREKTQPDAWTTFNTQSLLGGALLGQKKYADAEPLLLKGYEGMKTREKIIPKTGGGDLRMPQALDRLIQFYTETNKPEEVKRWQREKERFSKTPEKK